LLGKRLWGAEDGENWSPDGRYIPALSMDSKTLLLFDLQTQKWVELLKGTIAWLNWSRDGRYLIVLYGSAFTTQNRVMKIRISDHKTEQILDLKNFVPTGHYGSSLSLAPTIHRCCFATQELTTSTRSTGRRHNATAWSGYRTEKDFAVWYTTSPEPMTRIRTRP